MDYLDIDTERQRHLVPADALFLVEEERQMAGLQSIINGWTIEIQMLQEKILEVQKELENIKKVSTK